MAPVRTSARRPHVEHNTVQRQTVQEIDELLNDELFIDPMLGTPLAFYIEKEVQNRDTLVQLIKVSQSRRFSPNITRNTASCTPIAGNEVHFSRSVCLTWFLLY